MQSIAKELAVFRDRAKIISMKVLAIETSCDETAAAVLEKNEASLKVLSSVVSSKLDEHIKFGGVVPNLAARQHSRNIVPVVAEALQKAETAPQELDLLAVTQGPG